MLGGEIKVVMTLDDNDFSIKTTKNGQLLSEMRRNIEQTNNSVRSMESRFLSLGNSFRDTIFTLSLLRFALKDINDIFLSLPTAVLKSAGEMERLTKLMEGMSKETSNAARQAEALSNVKYVFNIAQNAPFEVKALTDAFVKMKSGGLDPSVIAMRALTDSVARFGGTSETLHRASIAIQQMAGKGVVSMEELRQQLGEAVPNAINLMAESAGRSTRQFAKMVSQGTVEATGALNSMFAAMIVENYGASKEMMNTWSGMLSLLKTKFELFKVQIAGDGSTDGDFFAEAKKSLRELIGLFDEMGAKKLANSLGESLASTISAVRSLVGFFEEYGQQIKVTGELLLFYFGASKLAALGSSIKGAMSERAALYRAEVGEIRENARLKAGLLESEAEGVRRVAAERYNSAQKATQLAGQLYAEQARMARQVEVLEAKAPGWSQAKIARLNEEIAKTREAITEIQTKAVAERNAAIAMQESAAAADRVAAAVRAGTSVKAADIALIQATANHSKEVVSQLNQKAAAAVKATTGLTALGTAMRGFNVIVSAFGGWITIAITTLAYLGEKLYEFLNRWERADEIAKRIKRGIADTADLTENANRVAELNKKIASAEAYFNSTSRPKDNPNIDPNSGRGVALRNAQKDYDARKAQYEKDLKLRDDMIGRMREQTAIIDREETRAQAAAFKDSVVDRITNSLKDDRAKIADLRKQRDEEVAKLISSGASEDKIIAVEKRYNQKINAAQKEAVSRRVSELQAEVRRLDDEMKVANEDQKRIILAKKEALTNEVDGLLTEWKKYAGIGEKLGTINTVKKVENQKKESPLIREAEALEGDLEQAKLKLNNYAEGVRDLARIRQEATVSFLKEAASGKFDVSKGTNSETGAIEMDYFGKLEERKKYFDLFKEQVLSGKKTVEEFIGSLKGLSAAEQELAIRIINAKSGIENTAAQQRALGDASRQAAAAQESMNAAMVRLESEGLAKADQSLTTMYKHFERLGKQVLQAGKDYAEYRKLRGEALADTVIASSVNFAADEQKKFRDSQLEVIKATQTATEAKDAEHRKRLEEINAQEKAQIAAIQKILDQEELSADKRKQLEDEISRVRASASLGRQAEINRDRIARQTELEKMVVGWKDTTEQMNKLTAQWANTIIDNIALATTGGKVEWRKMVADMAMQVYKVFLQRQFAEPIANMIGGFGKAITQGIEAANPRNTGTLAAKTAGDVVNESMRNLKEATDKAGGAMDSLSDNAIVRLAQSMWQSIKNMLFGETVEQTKNATTVTATTTLGTLTAAAQAAAYALMNVATASGVKGIAGLFGGLGGSEGGAVLDSTATQVLPVTMTAANGGIMSDYGPLSLNKYANGGIATGPQLALFGEGRMNEAYVPLPDGRSIPVTMKLPPNVGQGAGNVNISIVVNKDGSTTDAAGDDPQRWKELAGKVRDVVRGELVNQQRPGGLLAK